ncbi:MAG: hypothetical protein RUMPE_00765 [Eubacteriales bacterium SKADARSKE-1]|nr:hypothetical protein [Eubacteriales bacterium SKADARSKE-1]MDQ5983738.1 hypothetical protein [Eubacteriales bacterium SKADARSKE-1]
MKRIIPIILMLALILATGNVSVMANQSDLDMSHNWKEEDFLLDSTWHEGPCKNHKPTCKKYLIRYDDAEKIIDYFTKLANKAEDFVVEDGSIKQELALAVGGLAGLLGTGAVIYFSPFAAIPASIMALGSAGICAARNGIIAPMEETATGVFGFPGRAAGWVKSWFAKTEGLNNPDKGVVGEFWDLLCGDKSKESKDAGYIESLRFRLFGDKIEKVIPKEEIAKPFKQVVEDFSKMVKEKQWEHKDIIVVTVDTDPTSPGAKVAFDMSGFQIPYDKDKSEYFKNII